MPFRPLLPGTLILNELGCRTGFCDSGAAATFSYSWRFPRHWAKRLTAIGSPLVHRPIAGFGLPASPQVAPPRMRRACATSRARPCTITRGRPWSALSS